MENGIQAEIRLNEQALAQQIQQNLLAAIQQTVLNIQVQRRAELARILQQIQQNQGGGQQPGWGPRQPRCHHDLRGALGRPVRVFLLSALPRLYRAERRCPDN
jgi:hypothetical protein